MARHGPARQQNDDGGNKVPLWAPISCPTQPHAQESCAPPDDAHCRVLQVIVYPSSAPPMLGERVDASPESDYQAVEELLTPACPPQPHLPNKQQDCEDDSVCNERAAHDEVSQTLSQVIASAEAL